MRELAEFAANVLETGRNERIPAQLSVRIEQSYHENVKPQIERIRERQRRGEETAGRLKLK